MKSKKAIMMLPSAGVVFAGIMLIISPIMAVFAYRTIDPVTGLLLTLLFTVIGIWEITTFRAIGGTQVGEWPSIVRTLVISLVCRAVVLLIVADLLFILNLAALALEALALLLVVLFRAWFMPSAEEVQAALARFTRTSLKTASQCPKCSAVVEPDWSLCPECGTRLPRFCAQCGTELKEEDRACCKCGVKIEVPRSLIDMVKTLQATADMDASPETRSARYARLGDGLLKVGKLDEAIEAFKKAVQYTQFDRKRTNFMVKMAVVMANKGRLDEADQLLDAAEQLDPEDVAGARVLREELHKEPACPA